MNAAYFSSHISMYRFSHTSFLLRITFSLFLPQLFRNIEISVFFFSFSIIIKISYENQPTLFFQWLLSSFWFGCKLTFDLSSSNIKRKYSFLCPCFRISRLLCLVIRIYIILCRMSIGFNAHILLNNIFATHSVQLKRMEAVTVCAVSIVLY